MSRNAVISLVVALAAALQSCARPPVRTAAPSGAVLWREPSAHRAETPTPPRPPFRFVEEDMAGDSPKLLVTDASGTRWQIKLGAEAQTETVAVRIITAVGFFAEETYFLHETKVDGLEQLRRGREFMAPGSTLRNARFEARRESVRRGEPWDWARNPFVGTVELDALRAMMVLFNNYDARTDNNRILTVTTGSYAEDRYVVADLGASFGQVGGMGGRRTKNDVDGYRRSTFIERVDRDRVEFAYRTTPQGWARALFVVNPWYVAGEKKKRHDLWSVPIPAARWLATRLRPLAPQIRGAFEEAGYSTDETTAFLSVLTARIDQLSRL